MSQPTRARTTGAARKPRNSSPDTTPPSDASVGPQQSAGDIQCAPVVAENALLAPNTLARTLRAVAAELERDPALSRRVAAAVAADSATSSAPAESVESVAAPAGDQPEAAGTPPNPSRPSRAFRPRLVTGTSPDLGTGIPDPFALYNTLGADGLRAALDQLRLGTLRAIVREHSLDPKGSLVRQNDAAKLRAAILKAAAHHS